MAACHQKSVKYKIGSNILIDPQTLKKIAQSSKSSYKDIVKRAIFIRSSVLSLKLAGIVPPNINTQINLLGYEADESIFNDYMQRLKKSIYISDFEIQAARNLYAQIKAKKLYLLREIVLDDFARLKELKMLVANSQDALVEFKKLAKQNSVSKSAEHDGLIGYYNAHYNHHWASEFQHLHKNDMLIQKHENGYVLYFVESVIENAIPSDEKIKDELLDQKVIAYLNNIKSFFPVLITEVKE
jgi:hypothetical protein